MKFYITIFLLLYGLLSFSQGEIQDGSRKFNSNERSFGISFVSNGIGANYKIGRRIDGTKKLLFDFDFGWFRHPKEIKIKSYDSGNKFVYGKLNVPYNIRASIGRQKVIFEKLDNGSVSIQYFVLASIGGVILKPIYYSVITENGLVEQKFDITEIHSFSQIYNRSSFFKGVNEITFVPSLSIKAGFDFDFAKKDDRIHAIDAGFVFDAYLTEVPIMATEKNQQFIFTVFVTYRFGKTTETRLN